MNTRRLGLLVVLLAGCGQAQPPAPVAPPAPPSTPATPAAPAGPYCAVTGTRTHDFGGGTTLQIWNLRTRGPKTLTVRLTKYADGKAHHATDVAYEWNDWKPDAPPATGELMLLTTENKSDKEKDKKGAKTLQLAVGFTGEPGGSRVSTSYPLLIEGLSQRLSSSAHSEQLGPKNVLTAILYEPSDKGPSSVTLSSNPDELAALAKDGVVVVAVSLEWKP